MNKYKIYQNGRNCYLEIKEHFQNRAYFNNKATTANKALTETKYFGNRRNFTLETYYAIITKAFNDLEEAGTAHQLSEEQKITKFETGLEDSSTIN